MIKRILLPFLLLAFFLSVNAFAKDLPGDYAGAKADYLWKKLNLTNEQYSSVYQIFLDAHMKMDAMKTSKTDKAKMIEEGEKLHKEMMGKIEKVLTKDQLANWPAAKEKVCKVKPKHVVKKTTDSTEEVKKEEPKKEVKKEEPKKEVKKEEPKKEEKKK
ncbi:MAG: hypothetical protein L0Y76_04210 [Ignavibacteria bacterium]|nr:hypothetical protein [Ignavibacteria bacterium]